MSPIAVGVGAFGAGIPVGTSATLLTVGLSGTALVAGLGALVVATLGVLLVRRLQSSDDVAPKPVESPDPGGDEIRKAA